MVSANNLAMVYRNRTNRLTGAQQEEARGLAIVYLEKAAELGPDNFLPAYYLGMLQKDSVVTALENYIFEDAPLEAALAQLKRGAELKPEMPHFPLGMGDVWRIRAQIAMSTGKSPLEALEQAHLNYANALSKQDVFAIYQNRAMLGYQHARWLLQTGVSADAVLAEALKDIEKASAMLANEEIHYIHGALLLQRARANVQAGQDPRKPLTQAHNLFDKLLRDKDQVLPAQEGKGEAFTINALWAISQGDNPTEHFQKAHDAFASGEKSNYANLKWAICAAHHARYLKQVGEEFASVLSSGLKVINQPLAHNPQFAEAMAVKAALELLDPEKAAQAEKDMNAAISGNPFLKHDWQSWSIMMNLQVP